MRHFDFEQILTLDPAYRKNLINALPGYKPLHLMGTKSKLGVTNLALFSQVLHIGASPPLIGVLFRPQSVKRDSLENILDSQVFTLNHVLPDWHVRAHWTSGRWEGSEFEGTGLAEEYRADWPAPFVARSPVQLACTLVQAQTLEVNQTVLVIAQIDHVFVAEHGLRSDGSLDLNALETVSVSGLDEYHRGKKIARWSYAKPRIFPEEI